MIRYDTYNTIGHCSRECGSCVQATHGESVNYGATPSVENTRIIEALRIWKTPRQYSTVRILYRYCTGTVGVRIRLMNNAQT